MSVIATATPPALFLENDFYTYAGHPVYIVFVHLFISVLCVEMEGV